MLTKLDGNQGGAVKRDEIDTRVRRGTDPNSLNYKRCLEPNLMYLYHYLLVSLRKTLFGEHDKGYGA
ncbi:MAG: hypothetical protein LQ343_003682 [Gyalolechia ehrenbergii]|nr:MAG: hypothetical protein LQ343_003682 [Gyalolechia ehrenbergii]